MLDACLLTDEEWKDFVENDLEFEYENDPFTLEEEEEEDEDEEEDDGEEDAEEESDGEDEAEEEEEEEKKVPRRKEINKDRKQNLADVIEKKIKK